VIIASVVLFVSTALINMIDVHRFLDDALGIEWSAGVVRFLKANTQGLLIIAGLTLWYEYLGTKGRSRAEDRDRQELLEDFFADAAAEGGNGRWMVECGLTKVLVGRDVTQLTEMVVAPGPALTACTLRILVADSDSEVSVLHELEYDWSGRDFLFAVVADSATLGQVLTRLDNVLETWQMVEPGDLAAFASQQLDDTRYECRAADGRWFEMQISPVGGRRASRYHAMLQTDEESLVLLEVKAPREVEAPNRLRMKHTQVHGRDIAFEWWLTDRPTEVQSIYVDASRLSGATILPPLMYTARHASRGRMLSHNRWEAQDVGWLVAGQGILVPWTYYRPQRAQQELPAGSREA
jgi:hypothetical protein